MAWYNRPGKRLVGLMSLWHAQTNGPTNIAAIAKRESDRQLRGCGMATAEGANQEEVMELRKWLRANPMTKAAKAGK
jgi:GrpB-like predicted nucleotidyltransferase (UPF0157 family)